MIRLLLVLALCGSSAFAQTLTKPPTLLKHVDAQAPDGGVTNPGTVLMEVDLDPEGKVLEVKVVQGLSPELDAAAVAALKQFEFSPAEIDHQPAAVRIQYALTFEPPPPPLTVIDAGVPTVNLQGVLRTAGTREPRPRSGHHHRRAVGDQPRVRRVRAARRARGRSEGHRHRAGLRALRGDRDHPQGRAHRGRLLRQAHRRAEPRDGGAHRQGTSRGDAGEADARRAAQRGGHAGRRLQGAAVAARRGARGVRQRRAGGARQQVLGQPGVRRRDRRAAAVPLRRPVRDLQRVR